MSEDHEDLGTNARPQPQGPESVPPRPPAPRRFALGILLALSLVVGCGGGSGDGPSAPAAPTAAVALQVTFPPGACCTDSARVHVCGTAAGSEDIAVLRVNGRDVATQDGFANWIAEVELGQGVNDVRIECVTRDGDVVRDEGPRILRFGRALAPLGIGVEPSGDLLVLDSDADSVVRVDPDTGLESLVSGAGAGGGRAIVHPAALAVTPNGKRALVFDFFQCQLLSADPVTGDRGVVTSAGNVDPFALVQPAGGWDYGLDLTWPDTELDVATDGKRVYISGDRRRLVAIDLDSLRWWDYGIDNASPSAVAVDDATGRIFLAEIRRNEIRAYEFSGSSALLSPGESSGRLDLGFGAYPAMVFDAARNALWLVAADRRGFVLVDAETGARTAVRTYGSELREVSDMALDAARGRMLVASKELRRIWEVSLETGESRPLRNFDLGSGPEIGRAGSGLGQAGERVVVLDSAAPRLVEIDTSTARRRVVAPLGSTRAFDVTEDGHSAVAVERDAVHVVDLETGGARTLPAKGAFDAPVSVAIDARRNEAVVLDTGPRGGVTAVNLDTGARRTVTTPSAGPRQSATGVRGALAIDPAGDRALVTDPFAGTLTAFDLGRGTATTLAAPASGSGAALFMPAGVACDPATGDVYVTELQLPALVRVDPRTQERTLVSGRGRGSGPAFTVPANVAIDGPRAIVTDGSRVFAVDLASGDRVLVSR